MLKGHLVHEAVEAGRMKMRLEWIFRTRFHFGFILQFITVMSPFVPPRASLCSSRYGQNTFGPGS